MAATDGPQQAEAFQPDVYHQITPRPTIPFYGNDDLDQKSLRQTRPRGGRLHAGGSELPPPKSRAYSNGGPATTERSSLMTTSFSDEPRKKHDLETVFENNGPAAPDWLPLWLQCRTFIAFTTVFASIMAALVILYTYSERNEGLSTVSSTNHYLWTYGPTAVLTILAAFWEQVVYRTKQLMPWRVMAIGPQPASKSVLLDYVSSMDLTSLYHSIRNSHTAVTLAITASFMIKAVIVFSTGLFASQYINVIRDHMTLIAHNKFDGSNFDWSSVDARPASVVFGVEGLGLALPPGTTKQHAVQSFSDSSGLASNMTGIVDAFSASLDCELAQMTVLNVSDVGYIYNGGQQYPGHTPLWSVKVSTSTCTVPNTTINGTGSFFPGPSLQNETYTNSYGFARLATCGGGPPTSDNGRILISLGLLQYHYLWNGTKAAGNWTIGNDSYMSYTTLVLKPPQMFHILNSTSLLCTPHYSIRSAAVTARNNASSQTSEVNMLENDLQSSTVLPDVASWDVAQGVFASLNNPTLSWDQLYLEEIRSTFPSAPDMFFSILVQNSPAEKGSAFSSYWSDFENLATASSMLYGSMAAQVASQHLLVPASDNILGTTSTYEPRLFVHVLSFVLMEFFLALMVATTLWFCTKASGSATSRDPGSIGGVATVLAASPKFISLFRGTSTLALPDLSDRLSRQRFRTTLNRKFARSTFSIDTYAVTEKMVNAGNVSEETRPPVWWQPIVLRRPAQIATIALFVICIILLEILYRLSNARGGILHVNTNSYAHYAYTYVPALLMVALHLLFSAIDFNIRLLQPYWLLARGARSAGIVLDHSFSRTGIQELWVSARRRHWVVLATTLGSLLAPILTIAVSGLYTPGSYTSLVELTQLTGWTFNESKISDGTDSIYQSSLQSIFAKFNQTTPNSTTTHILTDLIVESNLSYPAWTFDELALPVVQVSQAPAPHRLSVDAPGSSVEATLQAIRGALNCTVVPAERTQITYATDIALGVSEFDWPMADFNATMLDGCGNYCSRDIYDGDEGPNNAYAPGYCTNISTYLPAAKGWASGLGYFGGIYNTNLQTLSKYPWCPSLAAIYGYGTPTAVENFTWIFCSTSVEQVDTEITLTLPEYSIPTAAPPRPVESTSKLLPGYAILNAPVQGQEPWTGANSALYTSSEVVNNPDRFLNFINMTTTLGFDNFFSALIYGRDGIPADELLGPANAPRLIAAVQHLFRVLLAQELSATFRTADPEDMQYPPPSYPLSGTLTSPNTVRLKQSVISTRILEGILATLTLCALIAFCLMDTRKVLPKNPSSIAAMASLLADSEMLSRDVIASQSEWQSDEALRRKWSSEGYLFSMGWWGEGEERRFGIDIGGAEKIT